MSDLGRIIERRRKEKGLRLKDLATISGISASHLGRIERGNRFPSARMLRRIAEPLSFEETDLFNLAGFLSSTQSNEAAEESGRTVPLLDPYVAEALAGEPFAVQRSVIGILNILKMLGQSTKQA